MIKSVQKKGKGLQKKTLLEHIQQIMKKEKGTLPSLNEVIIFTAKTFLQETRLNHKQKNNIEKAATAAKMTPEQILDKACDWALRFYGSKYASEPDNKAFNAGSAYQRIDEFVKNMMKKNEHTKHQHQKVFINQTYLVKNQGSNRDAIKGYLELNKEVLEQHHQKHDLHHRHNVQINLYHRASNKHKKIKSKYDQQS